MDRRLKEKALALLREQQGEDEMERCAFRVLERLIESDLTLDLVGTIPDEVDKVCMYVINKRALLSEFSGGVFSYLGIDRTEGINPVRSLYIARQQKRAGAFLKEEKDQALERIIASLAAGKRQCFAEDPQD